MAGWSSSAARWVHNPKVIGSNPIPASIAEWRSGLSRLPHKQKTAGSNPASRNHKDANCNTSIARLAHLVRALVLGTKGSRFNSCILQSRRLVYACVA